MLPSVRELPSPLFFLNNKESFSLAIYFIDTSGKELLKVGLSDHDLYCEVV